MKHLLNIVAALLLLATNSTAAERLTLKEITSGRFSAERMYGIMPMKNSDQYARISDDGTRIVQYAFKDSKETAVLFDAAATHGEKIENVDGYIMSPDGSKMLIQTKTQYVYRRSFKAEFYIFNVKSHKLEKLSEGGPQQVPTWSPDGNQVAFVRDGNLFIVKLLYDNAETQVTKDGEFNKIINGIPDWVYEEEFSYNKAFCFNADGTALCWVRFDESNVKTYSLDMFKGSYPTHEDNAVYPGFYTYKYPKAGEDNSKVTAWSYEIKTRQIRKLDVPMDEDGYMPRILATSNPNNIIVCTMNRHQDVLNIYTVNPFSTLSQLLIKEQVDKYIKEDVLTSIAVYDNHIILPSDRDGFMSLYIYTMNGTMERKIGDGVHEITAVYGYNEATGDVFYQAASPTPQDRQVFVSHKNGKTECLTKQVGWNSAIFSGDNKYFINTWSDKDTPYIYTVRDSKGSVLSTPINNEKLKTTLAQYPVTPKQFFTFTTSEGVELTGWMVKPADFNASKKYPVVMFQYSGPGSQQVVNSWNIGSMGQGGMFDYYLAQEGFIVVCVDGRGTGGRGAQFEKCTYLSLGNLEAKDQVETALWLSKQPYVDKENIGIWGWSYGGFCTLMSMSEGRPVFKAGVAVAPPTSYRYYDSVYTERFMRTPKENPQGYDDNAITRASQLHGTLLLCHGIADDNVHVQNTYEYTEALVQADKDFKMNLYTNRNHSIYGGNTRNHLLRQISEFFKDNLK